MASTTVNFNLKTAGYVNYANQTLTFRLLTAGADKDNDYVVLSSVVTATSAANGTGSVVLFTNGDSDIDSVFEVIFPNREKGKFKIPASTSSISLADLLVDHVPSGSAAQQNSVYAEAIKRDNHTGTQLLSTISDATEGVQDLVGAMVTGGTKTRIAVTYDDTNGRLNFVADSQTDENFTTADHSKLDALNKGISNGNVLAANSAVADDDFLRINGTEVEGLTAAEVRTALNVEDNADVTDVTNVTTAGALMDSEVTNLAFVKALTGGISNGNVLLANAAVSDNDFLKIDGTSVEGRTAAELRSDLNVENGADVTDTTNVTAAGALMDSEMQDGTGAAIKALTLPTGTATTINDFARDSLLNSDATSIKSALGVADTSAIAGFVPNSITFPTASDFLSIADSADLNVGTGDFTLSFWARLDGTGTEPILNKYSGAGYSLKFSSGSLILTIQGTGDPLTHTLATGLNDNKWHVYVVSVDRDANAVAYLDNVAQTAVDVSTIASSLDNTTAFRIGYDGANPSSEIAFGNYVALHKSALTASQAAQVYFSADAALTAVAPTLMVDLRKADKTFTDVSASPLAITTNGTVRFNQGRITSLDGATIGATTPAAVTGTSLLATTSLGYGAGSGGTVTQLTSKSTTTPTINKTSGQIVMNAEALAANTTVSFTLSNGTIGPSSVVIVNHASVGTAGAYQVTVGALAATTCLISVRNVTGGSLSEAIKLNFAVLSASHS